MVLSGSNRDGALRGARSSHAQNSKRALLIFAGFYLEFAQFQDDQATFTSLLQETSDIIPTMFSSLDVLRGEARETLRAEIYASSLIRRLLELSNRE
jgi:hypothetical protein